MKFFPALHPRWLVVLLALTGVFTIPAPSQAASELDVFTFHDHLNRDWKNEEVRIPASAAQIDIIAQQRALLGPDGQPAPYQVTPARNGQPPAISFEANVNAGASSSYRWSDRTNSAADAPDTDLKVQEDADTIRLTNKSIGISLRKKLGAGEAPVAKIQLQTGQWIGGSRLGPDQVTTGYSAKIVEQGPVFCEVECRMEFGPGASWVMNFHLDANEPVIEVKETMALGEKVCGWSLSLSDDFKPDQLFYRLGLPVGDKSYGANYTSEIKPGIAFVMEPWLRWWARPEQGAVFSVYRKDAPGLLSFGAGFAGVWVDPQIRPPLRTVPYANLVQDDKGLHLDFDAKNGQRNWIIGSYDKKACLNVLDDPALLYSTSIPHQYLIKHGQFPLNTVKDYVLDWPNDGEHYPHLLITRDQAAKYRATHAKTPQEEAAEFQHIVTPIGMNTMHTPLSLFYATGHEPTGKLLVEQTRAMLQQAVDSLLLQPILPYGAAPHHQQSHNFGIAPLVADAILDSKEITPQQRKQMLAQIAFCSYAINRTDYWSEDRGFAANPNMTTTVLGYRVALGGSIASHPMARAWVNDALGRLKFQLDSWSDANGGWLEAPHYAMVAYDAILGAALMAHNAGINDMIYDPKMKSVISWFGKWSTPPDARFGGRRHLPPVGNSYIGEPTGEFGLLASIWKDKDPAFASQMQWMHRQQGSPIQPGIGGGYPSIAGYREILFDPTVPEKAPAWGTEFFPKTGVVFRNKFPTDRETNMLLLAGSFDGWRSHWDNDSGSFTLWGKGRIIADDFGYYGLAPIEDHSLPASPDILKTNIFDVQTFAPSEDFDYAGGARGPWQRQIAFVKNADPQAPNYFVVSDSFKTEAPATWRIWLTANKVTPGQQSTLVEGKEDVDTDIFFATSPPAELKTEEKTRTAGAGFRPDGNEGSMATTQIGLVGLAPQEGAVTYVLYPRLKTEKPATFTSFEDGKVVQVKSDAGTDYIFLSATRFTWKQGSIEFDGKCGAVRFRGKQLTLSLGEAGSIQARGQTLTATKSARKQVVLN